MAQASPQEGRGGRRGRRLLRGLLRWGFRAGASLAILLLLLLHLLPLITNTRTARAAFAGALNRFLPGAQISVETLRVAPLHRRLLCIEGFRIAPRGAPDAPLVAVRKAECRWRPAALLDGRVHLTRLAASGVEVNVSRRDGRWSFADLLAARKPFDFERLRLPLPVRVDAVQVDEAAVSFAFEDLAKVRAEGVSARGSCELVGLLGGWAELAVRTGPVRLGAPRVSVTLHDGLGARLAARNDGGAPEVCGSVHADAVAADVDGLGGAMPVALNAGFGCRFDLARLALPELDVEVQVPSLIAGLLSASLTPEDGWALSGTALTAADGERLLETFRPLLPDAVASLDVAGRLLADASFKGRFGDGRGWLQLGARATATGLGAALRVAGPSDLETGEPLLDGSLSGGCAMLRQDVQMIFGGGLGGVAMAEAACSVPSVRAELPPFAGLTGGPLSAEVSLAASLPTLASVSARGRCSQRAWSLRSPALGEVSLPMEVAARLDAADLLSGRASRVELVDLTGALGGVVPAFRLGGAAAGRGGVGLALTGHGVLDIGQALGLADGLREEQRRLAGRVDAAGAAALALALKGTLSPVSLRLAVDGHQVLGGLSLSTDAVEARAARLASSFSLAAGVDSALRPYDVRWTAAGSADDVAAGPPASDEGGAPAPFLMLAGADGRASGDLTGTDLSRVCASLDGTLSGLAASVPDEGGPVSVGPLSVEAAARIEANPPAGDLAVADLRLALPGLAELRVDDGLLNGFGGDAVMARGRLELQDAAGLLRLGQGFLPAAAHGMRDVAGRGRAELELDGRLPMAERLAAALVGGRALPRPEVFPLDEFYFRDAPVDVRAALALRQGSAACVLPGGAKVGVAEAAADASLKLAQGDLAGEVSVTLPAVTVPGSPVPVRDVLLAGAFSLDDFSAFQLARCTFSAAGGVVEATAALHGAGLSRLRGLPTAGALLSLLDVEAESSAVVRPGGLVLVEGLALDGEAACELGVELAGGRRLALEVRPRFQGLSAAFGELFAVEGLDGGLRFSKQWRVIPPGRAAEAPLSQRMISGEPVAAAGGVRADLPEFGTAADRLLASDQAVRLRSLTVLSREVVRDAAADVQVRGSAVAVPAFHLHLLGGRLVGSASLAPREAGRELRTQGEFAGVDVRGLLPPGLRDIGGDARINGTFMLGAALGRAAHDASAGAVKDAAARLDVTRIGASACDRLLLALDPLGSNPSIVGARRALAVATPVRAGAALERGFVSLNVALSGLAPGLITEYAIPRFSVGQLFDAALVNRAFRRAAPALSAMDLLDAERIEVGADGSVGFR